VYLHTIYSRAQPHHGYHSLLILSAIIITLNCFASLYIGRAPAYDRSQKQIQIILIWLFPLFASIGLSYFLWCDRQDVKPTKQVGNHPDVSNAQAVHHASAYYHNR
jgi:hypothetical protein